MPTSNFQQWNPAAVNQESDAAYTADSLRTGGAPVDGLLPSPTFNKFAYQASTFIAAFGMMMVAKGYTVDDASLPVLAAVLGNLVTDNETLPAIVSVAYSPTPAFNAAAANGFQMTLNGNITASTITGVSPGQLVAFYFAQDSVGGRTVVFPSGVDGGLQPDPTPSTTSLQIFRASLSGNLIAATPVVSFNGTFMGPVKMASLTLNTPGAAGQVLANVGGLFVPSGTPWTASGSGFYRISPDGVIECAGSVNAAATGNQFSTAAITFPHAFTAVPTLIANATGLPSPSAHPSDCAEVNVATKSTTGATVKLQCSTPTGGGGADFDVVVPVDYYAIGK